MMRVLVFGALLATTVHAAAFDVQSSLLAANDDCDASSSQCHLGLLQSKAKILATVQRTGTAEGNSWEEGTCTIWGDGQVSVFDKARVSWMAWFLSFFWKPALQTDLTAPEQGVFWLVNSDDVKIQGLYSMSRKSKQASLKGIAVGGTFLHGNILRAGAVDKKVWWNDEEILKGKGSDFIVQDLVKAKYAADLPLVEDDKQESAGITLEFTDGVNMLINRKSHTLGASITLSKPIENQDGQCGNYNGDHEDDTAELIAGRIGELEVSEAESMFPKAEKKVVHHAKSARADDEKEQLVTEEGTCTIYGDPHIIGFDPADVKMPKLSLLEQGYSAPLIEGFDKPKLSLAQEDVAADTGSGLRVVHETGDMWLVKSSRIHIQARFNYVPKHKTAFVKVLAVGGPFLQNNTLRIAKKSWKAFWNDQEILSELPSTFKNSLVSAKYHDHSMLVQDPEKEARAPGIDISLPEGVKLLVNRGAYGLAVKITMPKLEEGQDGQCGNFNGMTGDDTKELISARVGNEVSVPETLFAHPFIHYNA